MLMALGDMLESQLWTTVVFVVALALIAAARIYLGETLKNKLMSFFQTRREAKRAHKQIDEVVGKIDEVHNQVEEVDEKIQEIERGQRDITVAMIELHADEENGLDEDELRNRTGVDEMDSDLIDA